MCAVRRRSSCRSSVQCLENPCAERLTFLKGVNVTLLCFLKFRSIWKLSVREVPTNINRIIVSATEIG